MKKLVLLFFLYGCAVGPNYHPPENTVADTWNGTEAAKEIVQIDEPPITEWWKVFDDPLLNKYIEKAAAHNNDVLTAESNILQARALRQIAASSFFPQIGADVNATKTYFSKNGPVFAIGPSTGSVPGTVSAASGLPFAVQVPQIQNLYNALFDATWEIDLFGKTRRMVEAAEANIGSAIEKRNDTLISVMAEIARNYIEVRSFQKKLQLLKENVEILEQQTAIIEKQVECGYADQLTLENIKVQLATEKSYLPDVTAEIHRCIYTISILVGDVPETLVEELRVVKPMPQAPRKVALGIRSDLLRRRPDIRQRERQLAAATANIGVAIASFFPTITLLGDGGLQSLMLRNLFTAGSRTWALGGDINMPVFEGGKLVGNLTASRAAASSAAYIYQQTVLSALEETESALIAYCEDLKTSENLTEAVERNQILVALSHDRYDKGLVSRLNLLESKRQLNGAEQTLLASNASALLDMVALYKALGGGWKMVDNK